MFDYIMSELYGSDWEDFICPLSSSGRCYIDRDSEECRKCEEDFMKCCEEKNELCNQ